MRPWRQRATALQTPAEGHSIRDLHLQSRRQDISAACSVLGHGPRRPRSLPGICLPSGQALPRPQGDALPLARLVGLFEVSR